MYIELPHTALPALAEGLEAGLRAAPVRGVQRECRRNRTPTAVAGFARRTTVKNKIRDVRHVQCTSGEDDHWFNTGIGSATAKRTKAVRTVDERVQT